MNDDAEKRILVAIEGLKQDVGSLKQDVGSLKQDVESVREDVKSVKQDVKNVREDVKSVKQDVKNVREDVKNVREDNTIAHKGLIAMIEAVQKKQEEHTRRFDKIDEIHKAMSMTVNGERTHVMKGLVKDVEMIKTHLSL